MVHIIAITLGSLTSQLYQKFRQTAPPANLNLGRDRDYAVDLIPKFILSSGELTRMLVHTDVVRYLEFKVIAGSYVYRDGRISKVPSTEMEAIKSPLMGLFEKRRARNFFQFLQNWKEEDPATHQGELYTLGYRLTAGMDINKVPMKDVYYKFGLEAGTQDFIGHAMALWLDDEYVVHCPEVPNLTSSYKTKPARPTIDRIILYTQSMARYGKSPYIYPLYGLGELPQAFARLSAIYGGTYMLDKQIESINVGEDGKFTGVTSAGETVRAKRVIGDPSYFGAGKELGEGGGQVRVIETGKVVRAICILKHPIPGTDDSDSAQIIIPQNQVGRKNGESIFESTVISAERLIDIYIAAVSASHNVAAKDVWIAMVSTIVETSVPEREILPGLQLLGSVVDK